MKAVLYEQFGGPLSLETVSDPSPPQDGVVIEVQATGICRSDWHGWQGHDSDIQTLPHIPGHELAGIIAEAGSDVRHWRVGDRVTLPFAMGCGTCEQCRSGNQQICDDYYQPGFKGWGSFAEYVAVPYADTNLVRLPESMDFVTAASLGCRFITAFRAVVHQGRVRGGEWVAVHGCGGVGLSAIMIASAMGANVIAVDINASTLELARSLGATHTINARHVDHVSAAILELTRGGAQLSLDALGSIETCQNSILSLRKRGRHVQVGLMVGEDALPPLPMGPVISKELEILGSHGMQAFEYKPMLDMITAGVLDPARLVSHTVSLADSIDVLTGMGDFNTSGVVVIDRFE